MEAFQGPRWRENGPRPCPGPMMLDRPIRRSYPNSIQVRPAFMERRWGRNNDRRELWNGNNDGSAFPINHPAPPQGSIQPPHSPALLHQQQLPSPEKNGCLENQWPTTGNIGLAGNHLRTEFHHPRRKKRRNRPLLNGLVQGEQHPSRMLMNHSHRFPNPNTYHNPPHPGGGPIPGAGGVRPVPAVSPHHQPQFPAVSPHHQPQFPPVSHHHQPQFPPVSPHHQPQLLPSPHPGPPPHNHSPMYGTSKHSTQDLSVSPLNQDGRGMDSPLSQSSFAASPSSNESENSSPLPRDPRDPRHRSLTTAASPLHNSQDKSSANSLPQQFNNQHSYTNHSSSQPSCSLGTGYPSAGDQHCDPAIPPRPLHPPHYDHQQQHLHTGGMNDSSRHHPSLLATDSRNPFPASAGYNMMARRGRGPPTTADGSQHYPPPVMGDVVNGEPLPLRIHSHQPKDIPNGGRLPSSVQYKEMRHSIDHSYTSHEAPQQFDINRPPLPLQRSYHRTLMPCVSIDIPIPTLDSQLLNDHTVTELKDDVIEVKDHEDTHREKGVVVILIDNDDTDDETSLCILENTADNSSVSNHHPSVRDKERSNVRSRRHHPMNGNPGDSVPGTDTTSVDQERTVSVGSDNNSDVFSISPFSINSFTIDLDTEVESTISPVSSNPSSEEDSLPLPLNVSLPLSKVSLPTKVLLKPMATPTQSSCPVAPKSNSGDNHPLVDKIQTRGTLKKQQADALQLRNRALPRRNLYLFASRKAPARNIKDSDCTTSKTDEPVADTTTTDSDSTPTPVNLDNSFIIIDETEESHDMASCGSKETMENFEKESTESLSNCAVSSTTDIRQSGSLSPSRDALSPPNNKIIRSDDTPSSLSSEERKKKPQKFQDFVPIILRSRSRAETKTVQRRQKMAIEMQKNEQENQVSPTTTELDSEQDSISCRIRKRKRLREKQSPAGSSQDDVSSIMSESIVSDGTPSSSLTGLQTEIYSYTPATKEFSADLINRSKRIMLSTKGKFGSGDTGLHYICRTGKHDILHCLLTNEENYNINIQDNAGWTPLHEACTKGHKNIVALLLEHGADPNLQATDGTRPIHDAIESGHFEIVKYLVDHGADPTVEYSEKTPIELANTSGYPEIAEYLTEIYRKRKLSDKHKTDPTPKKVSTIEKSVKTHVADDEIHLPIEGYQEPFLGPELDKPVFMISAIMEMSSEPMLPVYNLRVSSGFNPRKHNFHILTDVLEHLQISRKDLLSKLSGICSYSMSVKEFISQVRNNQITKHAKILDKLKRMDKDSEIELIPLCSGLHQLLSIVVENIDD